MQDLDGLQPERLDTVEDPLAGAEQDGRDVERQLVDDRCNEGLAHGRGATGDVYAALAGRLTRLCVSGVEAVGDEVERGPAFHLDRLVGVVGEHEHRRVVRRLGAPPTAPVLIPLAADRPEHVPPHDVGAAWAHEPAGRRRVGVVGTLVAEMPSVELAPAFAQRILAALVGPSDETVERDRHVAGGVRHRRPPKVVAICKWRLASGDSTLVQATQPSPRRWVETWTKENSTSIPVCRARPPNRYGTTSRSPAGRHEYDVRVPELLEDGPEAFNIAAPVRVVQRHAS